MKLTKNFSLEELVYSETAKINGINNSPGVNVLNSLSELCVNVLQPLRDYYNKPVVITSGYRCGKLNKLIGGVNHSQHMKGEAVDLVVLGEDLKSVFLYIKNNLPYDQLLLEKSKNGTWIHVSYTKNNRKYANENYLV